MVFVSTVVTEPRSISRGARMAICLIPHLAMTSGFLIFLDFETLGNIHLIISTQPRWAD